MRNGRDVEPRERADDRDGREEREPQDVAEHQRPAPVEAVGDGPGQRPEHDGGREPQDEDAGDGEVLGRVRAARQVLGESGGGQQAEPVAEAGPEQRDPQPAEGHDPQHRADVVLGRVVVRPVPLAVGGDGGRQIRLARLGAGDRRRPGRCLLRGAGPGRARGGSGGTPDAGAARPARRQRSSATPPPVRVGSGAWPRRQGSPRAVDLRQSGIAAHPGGVTTTSRGHEARPPPAACRCRRRASGVDAGEPARLVEQLVVGGERGVEVVGAGRTAGRRAAGRRRAAPPGPGPSGPRAR